MHPTPAPLDPATAAPESTPGARTLAIQFTASGRDYFRLWIVHLVLTIATLGLYAPFAKVRQWRYLQENTLIDGAPLAFHGDPWRLLRGYLLVGGTITVYVLLSSVWQLADAMWLAAAAAGPWLLRSVLRLRLGQTSWHGMHMRFEGSVVDAYRVFWPVAIPLALVAIGLAQVTLGAALDGTDLQQLPTALLEIGSLLGLGSLLMLGLVPWIHCRFKHYQHGHCALADEHTRLDGVRARDFYAVQLGLVAVSLVVLLGLSPIALLTSLALPDALVLVWPLLYAVGAAATYAYLTARLQNLVWSHTRSAHVRFHSQLSATALFGLTLKNSLLTVLTLGLYWPYAAVATRRMRLAAVSIAVSGPVESFTDTRPASARGTAGEAAGDLLGIEIAL